MRVAGRLGLPAPPPDPEAGTDAFVSPALSQAHTAKDGIATRQVAVLAADGVDAAGVRALRSALTERGAIVEVIASHGGMVHADGGDGDTLPVDRTLMTVASVLYDGVVVAGGQTGVETLTRNGEAVHFVLEAFKHAKPVAAFGAGVSLLRIAGILDAARVHEADPTTGVITTDTHGDGLDERFVADLARALANHRTWQRATSAIPA
ncbi:Catalase CatB [Mycobacteroides abscessus subsp. abscessus]|nr:Catalase CatB [Mycobacteroides abscessus subsp. abscessus]